MKRFLDFLEWYAGCLQRLSILGCNIGKSFEYDVIDSGEELMLECTLNMLHGKKWDGEKWVKGPLRDIGLDFEGYLPF